MVEIQSHQTITLPVQVSLYRSRRQGHPGPNPTAPPPLPKRGRPRARHPPISLSPGNSRSPNQSPSQSPQAAPDLSLPLANAEDVYRTRSTPVVQVISKERREKDKTDLHRASAILSDVSDVSYLSTQSGSGTSRYVNSLLMSIYVFLCLPICVCVCLCIHPEITSLVCPCVCVGS